MTYSAESPSLHTAQATGEASIMIPSQFKPDADFLLPSAPYTIPIAGGAYHVREHYEPFCNELTRRGHTTINPDFDCSDVSSTFEKDSDAFVETLGDADRLFFYVHSRGIERFARALHKINPDRVIGAFISNSAGPHGLLLPPAYEGEPALPRYTPLLSTGIRPLSERLSAFNPNVALKTFYSEVDADRARWAAGLLVNQRAPGDNESVVPIMPPSIPIYYVLGSKDMAINNNRAERVPRQWLGPDAQPAEYEAFGHSPFLERITYLADLVLEKAVLAETIRTAQKS